MEFSWDDKKAVANLAKHKVSFHEAASVFDDTLALTFDDPDHSIGEQRPLTFGESVNGRLVAIIHTARGSLVRIISARPATRKERKIYEEG